MTEYTAFEKPDGYAIMIASESLMADLKLINEFSENRVTLVFGKLGTITVKGTITGILDVIAELEKDVPASSESSIDMARRLD